MVCNETHISYRYMNTHTKQENWKKLMSPRVWRLQRKTLKWLREIRRTGLFLCAIISSQVSISHHRRGTDIYFDFFFLAYDPKGIDLFIEKQKKSLRANARTRIHLRSWKLAICLSLSISLALYQIFFQMSAGIQSTIIITQRLIEALLGCIECLNRKIKV